jgi:hypothetical protein
MPLVFDNIHKSLASTGYVTFPLSVHTLQLNVVNTDMVNNGEEQQINEHHVFQSYKLKKFRLGQERNKYTGSTVEKLREGRLPARLNLCTFVTTMATFIRVLLWCTQDLGLTDISQRDEQLFKAKHGSEETFLST